MKTAYAYDHRARYTIIKLDGDMDDDRAQELRDRFWVAKGEGLERRLVDLRGVEAWRVSDAMFRSLVEDRCGGGTPIRIAALVASPLTYGILRMGQAWTADAACEIEIFEDVGEAMAWLSADSTERDTDLTELLR